MRKYLLRVPLDDYSLAEIVSQVRGGERRTQVFVNVHKVIKLNSDDSLRALMDDEHCVFSTDGRWVEWLAKAGGFSPKQRFGGLDVVHAFCKASQESGLRLFFLGARQEIIPRALEELKKEYPRAMIVGFRHGYGLDERGIVQEIRKAEPQVLFLALPSPQKEVLGYRLFKEIPTLSYVSGIGGALDILAGKAKRAPRGLQLIGMEWLYRCLQEPARLFGRYARDALSLARLLITSRLIADQPR